ncbi:Clr5 domain-containing protein [Fusarium sp. Ph1]|nr:Clr5 domain-containing protein [Fusarium sp. Ph1]
MAFMPRPSTYESLTDALIRKRKVDGKDTEILVNGKPAPTKKLNKELRRYARQGAPAQHSFVEDTSKRVVARTPPSSPTIPKTLDGDSDPDVPLVTALQTSKIGFNELVLAAGANPTSHCLESAEEGRSLDVVRIRPRDPHEDISDDSHSVDLKSKDKDMMVLGAVLNEH